MTEEEVKYHENCNPPFSSEIYYMIFIKIKKKALAQLKFNFITDLSKKLTEIIKFFKYLGINL
jgi:hypothetical protein